MELAGTRNFTEQQFSLFSLSDVKVKCCSTLKCNSCIVFVGGVNKNYPHIDKKQIFGRRGVWGGKFTHFWGIWGKKLTVSEIFFQNLHIFLNIFRQFSQVMQFNIF